MERSIVNLYYSVLKSGIMFCLLPENKLKSRCKIKWKNITRWVNGFKNSEFKCVCAVGIIITSVMGINNSIVF